jgi:hypothetical protein
MPDFRAAVGVFYTPKKDAMRSCWVPIILSAVWASEQWEDCVGLLLL